MRHYLLRVFVAVFAVVPIMFLVVPIVDLLLSAPDRSGAHESVWIYFMNMLGFYGGYVLLAAVVGSVLHSWLTKRFRLSGVTEVLAAIVVGVLVLLPQGLAFGVDYWVINAAAGAAAGGLYGLLVIIIWSGKTGTPAPQPHTNS